MSKSLALYSKTAKAKVLEALENTPDGLPAGEIQARTHVHMDLVLNVLRANPSEFEFSRTTGWWSKVLSNAKTTEVPAKAKPVKRPPIRQKGIPASPSDEPANPVADEPPEPENPVPVDIPVPVETGLVDAPTVVETALPVAQTVEPEKPVANEEIMQVDTGPVVHVVPETVIGSPLVRAIIESKLAIKVEKTLELSTEDLSKILSDSFGLTDIRFIDDRKRTVKLAKVVLSSTELYGAGK